MAVEGANDREIHMDDKPDEMHFKVGGKVLHFGKREFALITGLSFKKPEKDFISPPNSSSLMRTYFPNQNRVSGSKVKDLLSKRNSTCSSLDKVKLALLLVVHKFLMGRPDRDTINISYWHLVDDLEEFNKYPWGEATFGKIAKFRSPLLYQANKENSGAGGECYKVVGIAHALLVWALDIMPGLLNLCGRKIESRGWQPHMLCVLCTRSPEYPRLIRTLEVNDVHVLSDIMWQKGDANQLLVLGLEEGTTELSSFIWTEKERHEYHGESSQRDSFHETEDCNQDHEVPDAASVLLSKKRKVSTEENECGTSMKDSHSKDVHKGNMSSCSREKTTRTETLEVGELVEEPLYATIDTSSSKGLTHDSTLLYISTSSDISPFPPGFTRASVQERVEGFERVDNLKIPEEYVILYKKIYEKHGHMATKKVIKFNDAMLLTCTPTVQLMDRRKSLRKNVAVEGVNDSVYIHPQKFRDKNMQVSNCSSLPLLAEVRDLLSVDEKAIFKGTSIGHLLSVPANSKFSGTIVHFLHSREIHVDDKPDEMHFKVGGKILHFGKREFALITGLSFKKPERAFVSPANPPSLMTAHFPNHNCVSASTVKAFLSEKNSNCSSLDRVHVRSDIVWQKGDGYQLIELGLEEGTPELNSFIRTEKEFHKYHEGEFLHEREDGNQSGEVLQTAPRVASKKRKTSIVESHPYDENLHSSEPLIIPALPILMTQESVAKGKENNIPHASVEDSRGEDAHTGNMSSCSGAKNMGVKSLEVDEHVQESVDVTTSTSTSKGMSPDSTLLNISTSADVISSPQGLQGI
ncbi:hypothetical protein C5167_000414 [Papaver somniferum]|uniref:DUF1985 domain-containing protein n=1 Tax=Papaver somniferum TaxID=3469 RepID=A0A4Y7KWJ2_PAPSO|nr:hypothetical protein C5167_000414 [Papaver somniferum]